MQSKTMFVRVVGLHNEFNMASAKFKPPIGQGNDVFQRWKEIPENRIVAQKMIELPDELELQSECFYWVANRARSILKQMPGLSSFEALGIRNVRNNLIEHPERPSSNIMISSFGYGMPQGPVLKALRYSHQTEIFPDAGLFVNAVEFFTAVETSATRAVENLSA